MAKAKALHLTSVSRVYFLELQAPKRCIKIGSSMNPRARLRYVEWASPWRVVLLGKCNGGVRLEYDLHERFKSDRMRGEWFMSSKELLDTIHALCSQ